VASALSRLPGEKLKPAPVKTGDPLAVVAPAGRVDEKAVAGGVRVLETLGFRVTLGRHLREARGYLAGPDEARAEDLNEALADPDVRGIICARGGYGASRILWQIDYEAARQDPKVFVGYSDVTALHLAFARETGLVTFHGPMVESLGEKLTRFTLDSFARAITSTDPLDVLPVPDNYPTPRLLGAGRATGPLAGGNLSLITALMGTPYEMDARGRVLVLEDAGEEPYRIDRMLAQLGLSGKLAQAAGVAVGELVGCEARPADAAEGREGSVGSEGADGPRHLGVEEVLTDHLASLGRPVLSGLPFGHGRDKWTLPLGVPATVDAYKARLIVEEPACVEPGV
jgi:muramoyltetrapeptide carboxypeptidase